VKRRYTYLGDFSGVVNDCNGRHGEPLFAELVEEIYPSPNCTLDSFRRLKTLGASTISLPSMIARAKADLGRSNSKLKAIATDDDWHSRTAKLISMPFEKHDYRGTIEDVKSLELISLQGKRWVPARSSPIFQPNIGDAPIPMDLGPNLVQSNAVTSAARMKLFSHIGVVAAVPSNIISQISWRYTASSPFTMKGTISHLRYLYWNFPQNILVLDKNIRLVDQNTDLVYRTGQFMKYIYFEGEEEEEEEEEEWSPKISPAP
jgi:hypothetical protein